MCVCVCVCVCVYVCVCVCVHYRIERRALRTTTVGGVTIPADCCITIPIYSLMHDPELFPQPDSFIPERSHTYRSSSSSLIRSL